MVGTDINLESLNSARDNIKRNNLENLIRGTVFKVKKSYKHCISY